MQPRLIGMSLCARLRLTFFICLCVCVFVPGAIEICVTTAGTDGEHRYLQSDENGVVRAHELNTAAATWTIVDSSTNRSDAAQHTRTHI